MLPKLLTVVTRARTNPRAGPLQAPSDELSNFSVDVALDLWCGDAGKADNWLRELLAHNVYVRLSNQYKPSYSNGPGAARYLNSIFMTGTGSIVMNQ